MRIPILLSLLCILLPPTEGPAAPDGGTVTGSVVVVKNGKAIQASDVWVYLQPTGKLDKNRKFGKRKLNITQQGRKFSPRVQVIPLGSSVGFPNADKEEHNVFSPGLPGIAGFDLGRYVGGDTKEKPFMDIGEHDIFCDIHSKMAAKVKVVPSEWIAEVKGGTFSVLHVPAGTYKVIAWMPDSDEVSETITVTNGGTVTPPSLHLQAGKEAFGVKPHTRKDGSNYTVYQ